MKRGGERERGRHFDPESISTVAGSVIPNSKSIHPLTIHECPTSWDELQLWFRRALQAERKLAIAYPPPPQLPPQQIWEKLVGIAKFMSRTNQSATLAQLQEKLDLSDRTLHLGLSALSHLGFEVQHLDWSVKISRNSTLVSSDTNNSIPTQAIQSFLSGIEEEQFLRHYFYQVPLSTIQEMAMKRV